MEKLDQTVTPSLNSIAQALRTGKKGLFDPTRSSKLFMNVYDITVKSGKKDPREIAQWITKWCVTDLTEHVVPVLRNVSTGEEGDVQLFGLIAREFAGYKQIIKTLRFLFLNTDNVAASKLSSDSKSATTAAAAAGGGGSGGGPSQQMAQSESCALRAFYDSVFQPVEERLRTSIFRQIDRLRDGVDVDRAAIRDCCSAFERIGRVQCVTSSEREQAYVLSFARPYFDRVEQRVLEDFAEHGQKGGYVQFLLDRRDLEGQLAKLCLTAVLAPKAIAVYDSAAVSRRASELLNHPTEGLAAVLDEERFDSVGVSNLYSLFWNMTPPQRFLLDTFCLCWGECITRDLAVLKKQWQESTQHETTIQLATRVMNDILALLRRKDLIVKSEFWGNSHLERQKHLAFLHFLNPPTEEKLFHVPAMARAGSGGGGGGSAQGPGFVFPQLLAHYVDQTLRDLASASSTTSAEDSQWADPISQLFALVQDKDLFAEYFRLHMSKRLLTQYVDDNERAVLSRLQRQSGKLFTHKFEGMINDINQATGLQNEFTQAFPASQHMSCDFFPKVLTAAYWPSVRRDEGFISPDALVACEEIFSRFYRRKFPTRQLRWQPERANAVLTVAFPKGSREVSCNMMQAAVLLVIDRIAPKCKGEGVPLTEVARFVGLGMEEVKPLIASMLFARGLNMTRRVGVEDEKASLESHQCMELNHEYSVRMRKLKLPSAASSAARAQDDVVKDSVIDASRAQALDACIVRLMKARKKLRIAEIIDLAIAGVSRFFVAQPRMIKIRIEALCAKDFIDREEDSEYFVYVA